MIILPRFLTQVLRRTFQSAINNMTDRAHRMRTKVAMLLCDIDYFKKVNDTYGHPFGDEVLREVAVVLKDSVRNIDLAARYGGEEFTVILPETAGEEARTVAQRIRAALEAEPFSPADGENVTVTISIGLTEYDPKEKLSTFIQRADLAMYRSKRSGRNKVSMLYADATSETGDTT